MATPIPHNRVRFTLAELAALTGGQLVARESDTQIVEGIAIDSRAVTPGALFVAIRGESQDGARFVPNAIAAGARALLVPRGGTYGDGNDETPRIEVDDTTLALGALAAAHRLRWGGRVIAITGSAGKTTTKELTAAALEGLGVRVLKTLGNLNNQFGVPMTLFCLGAEHDIAVLELGTSGVGEIASLGAMVRPDVATVLLAALAHTEGLPSLEAVADEKSSLWDALSDGGVAVVNAEDAELVRRVRSGKTTLSFGASEGVTVRLVASALHVGGTRVRVAIEGEGEHALMLRLIGHAAAIDACAALASVRALYGQRGESFDIAAALTGMARLTPTEGRMACVPTRAGVTLCDDSYNANPSSMALGLETLVALAREADGRSIAVLGDMKELGGFAQPEHARIGELAVRLGIDVLVGCGADMAHATSAAARLAAGRLAPHPTRVAHVMAPLDAIALVGSMCRRGDVVLVKGSRSMAMERVAVALAEQLGGSP